MARSGIRAFRAGHVAKNATYDGITSSAPGRGESTGVVSEPGTLSQEVKSEPGEVSQETRHEAMRRASDVIASQPDLNGVLENVARFLPSVVRFEFLAVVLHDAERQVFRLHAFESSVSHNSEVGTETLLSESSATIILDGQKPIIINDTETETRFADLVGRARSNGIRSMCFLPLTSPGGGLGVLVFGTTYQKDYYA